MQTKGDGTPVRAVVHRDATGNWVMSWAGGYAYDFWTDREAAERAAELATELIQRHGVEHPEVIDEALRSTGALGRARVRRRLASGTFRKPVLDEDRDGAGEGEAEQHGGAAEDVEPA